MGWGGWGGGFGASTIAEGYYRGLGDAIRSQGIYNQLTAQAATELEEARQKNIENRLRSTEAFYEQRRMHDEYVESTASLRRAETAAYAERRRNTPPRRLGADALDGSTGELHWPSALMGDEYTELRTTIQDQFYHRAQSRLALSPNDQAAVTNAAVQMNAMLRERASQIESADFVLASRFIRELRGEVRTDP